MAGCSEATRQPGGAGLREEGRQRAAVVWCHEHPWFGYSTCSPRLGWKLPVTTDDLGGQSDTKLFWQGRKEGVCLYPCFVRAGLEKLRCLLEGKCMLWEILCSVHKWEKGKAQDSAGDKMANSNCSSQWEHSLCCASVCTLPKLLVRPLHREVSWLIEKLVGHVPPGQCFLPSL